MTPFIALDTSTENCSVALATEERVFARSSDTPQSHAKSLLPMIDELIVEAGITLPDVQCLALTHGPGSFTGIRIGLSIAQGLAFGLKCPIVAISSLATLAASALSDSKNSRRIVVPALDARMKEIYWAIYLQENGCLTELQNPSIGSSEQFNEQVEKVLADNQGLDCLALGHGWTVPGVNQQIVRTDQSATLPHAGNLISLIQSATQSVGGGDLKKALSTLKVDHAVYENAAEIEPVYLRNEVTWEKRKRIRS